MSDLSGLKIGQGYLDGTDRDNKFDQVVDHVQTGQGRMDVLEARGLFDKGNFATEAALITAYPIGQEGWFASLSSSATDWHWRDDSTAWVDTGGSLHVNDHGGLTGLGNDSHVQYFNAERLAQSRGGVLTTGVANQYTAALGISLIAGQRFKVRFHIGNTGNSTLVVDDSQALKILTFGSEVPAGYLNGVFELEYVEGLIDPSDSSVINGFSVVGRRSPVESVYEMTDTGSGYTHYSGWTKMNLRKAPTITGNAGDYFTSSGSTATCLKSCWVDVSSRMYFWAQAITTGGGRIYLDSAIIAEQQPKLPNGQKLDLQVSFATPVYIITGQDIELFSYQYDVNCQVYEPLNNLRINILEGI